MKKYIVLFSGSAVIIVLFSLLIYPTMYEYTHFEIDGKSYPIVINRFTGDAKIMHPTLTGWVKIKHDQPYQIP